VDDIADRIESMRQSAAEKARAEAVRAAERRKEQWAAIQRDPVLAKLLIDLRASGMQPKPIYVLMKQDDPTTKPGTYRIRLPDGSPMAVTVPEGFQRIL
jgi:hypothetical protein